MSSPKEAGVRLISGSNGPACLDATDHCCLKNHRTAGRSWTLGWSGSRKSWGNSGPQGYRLRKNCGGLRTGQQLADAPGEERTALAPPLANQNAAHSHHLPGSGASSWTGPDCPRSGRY